MSDPQKTSAEILLLARRAGFDLTPEQAAEYLVPYEHIQQMAKLIRTERSYMVEPAHTFGFPMEPGK